MCACGERAYSPEVEDLKQIPKWPCHEGASRKISLGSFPKDRPNNNVWFALRMRTSAWAHLSVTLFCFTLLAPMCFCFVTCFPQLLPLLFLCLQLWLLIFTSRVTEAISDANSSALAGNTKQNKKSRKPPAGPLACRRSCEDRLPMNSASWKSVLQWQGLPLLILHVTSFPVHPNFLLDHPLCSTKWILAPQHS